MAKATKKAIKKTAVKTKAKAATTAKKKAVKRSPKKTKTAKAAKPVVTITLTHDQIAARAYEIWVRKGRRAGNEATNWKEAEKELQAQS